MTGSASSTSVFDYTDYRKYLIDYYHESKKTNKAFSYRFFARKAGITSVGLYKDVIDGRQSLGRTLVLKFSSALGLRKNEAVYFENMVYFNEARTIEERKLYFERMVASCQSKTALVDAQRYEYYSRWYYSAVRAFISCFRIRAEDTDYLAEKLVPPVRPEQVRKAFEVLEKLKLIAKDEEGIYRLEDALVSTGTVSEDKRVEAMNIVSFQKTMLEMAGRAYDIHPFSDMSMSTLTLSVSEESYLWIKEEIKNLREKVINRVQKETKADRVYQMNYNLFPLSATGKKRDAI